MPAMKPRDYLIMSAPYCYCSGNGDIPFDPCCPIHGPAYEAGCKSERRYREEQAQEEFKEAGAQALGAMAEALSVFDETPEARDIKADEVAAYFREKFSEPVPAVAVATVGELIDRLSIVNIKIYHLEDTVRESEDAATVCTAAKRTRELNRERSELKNAITTMVQGSGARLDVKV